MLNDDLTALQLEAWGWYEEGGEYMRDDTSLQLVHNGRTDRPAWRAHCEVYDVGEIVTVDQMRMVMLGFSLSFES